jgi:hypothetical protein
VLDSLDNFGATVERTTTEAYDRFQRWFGSAQDRAEQWFQTHVRIVTIVCSICAAFLLQLDTAEIYRQLRDQPKLVEALVKSGPPVLQQGAPVTDSTDTPAYETYLLWLKKHPQFPLKTSPRRLAESYRQAIAARLQEAETKGAITREDSASFLAEYDALTREGSKEFLKHKQETVDRLRDTLDEAGFDIVPHPFFGRWDKDPTPTWARALSLPRPIAVYLAHLVGIFATAGLLSLGAPFWFNLLKNLTSLRPALATLIEKRPTSAPALPAAPSSPPFPS